MKIAVKVLPKSEVLDSQGRAVASVLKENGFVLKDCHVGRYITLEFVHTDESKAMTEAKKIAEFVLCNSLTETYELERL